MGTPDYIAPEQINDSHAADGRSDLYSLGCTLYFLLAGQVPFPGGDATEKLLRQQTEEPQPLEHIRPQIPKDGLAAIRRLMAKDPAERFQTAEDLVKALAPFALDPTAAETTELVLPTNLAAAQETGVAPSYHAPMKKVAALARASDGKRRQPAQECPRSCLGLAIRAACGSRWACSCRGDCVLAEERRRSSRTVCRPHAICEDSVRAHEVAGGVARHERRTRDLEV